MSQERNGKIQSVERAVAILKCFQQEPQLGITEIGKMVNLPKSTVFGIVNTLLACEMLDQDKSTGKYRLGMECYHLGQHTNLDYRTAALPFLRNLVTEFGETANMVSHDGTHIIYIEKLESPNSMMRVCTTIGQRLPFYCSGVGRSILAFLSEWEIEKALASYDYAPYTDHTPRDAETVRRQLVQIRAQGYCVDREEFENDIICVGTPVFSPKHIPVAGISVSGPKFRMSESYQKQIAAVLMDYAGQISKRIFG